jgi:hypothetical protein
MASRGGPSMRFPRGGGAAGGQIQRVKTHVIPFSDHSGREALMVFDGWVSCPLPPLFSFAIYFTHPKVTLETVKPVEVLEVVKRKTPFDSSCSIRLELYFLPTPDVDSSNDDCIAHYREEKAARGYYTRQIQALDNSATDDGEEEEEEDDDDDDGEQQQGGASVHGNDQARQLPGLVPSYIDRPSSDYYHGIIFCYPGADLSTDLASRICFDRISEVEYAHVTEGNDEFHCLPLVYVSSMPFQESDTTKAGERFVGMAMFDAANARTKNETIRPWQEARERGWKS